MNNSNARDLATPLDSLDYHQEEFQKSRVFPAHEQKEEHIFKNFYRQELDEILHQRNKYKSMEKLKQDEDRRIYNQRMKLAQQAERIKEISYKNYYQMIMNNQENIKSKYVNPFQQRDDNKTKFIDKGIEEGRVRSQLDYERQVRRQENVKKQFQNVLSHQLNQKQQNVKRQHEEKSKNNQHLRNILLTPQQVQRLQRQRKQGQMCKYKQDLDKIRSQKYTLTQSQLQNPQFSPSKGNSKSNHHDLLLNPLPFNIQNPYILRQMQKKGAMYSNPSFRTVTDNGSHSQTKRNIFG